MAGSVAVTKQEHLDRNRRPVWKYTIAWVSDAAGAVSGTLTDYISGEIVRVVFKPDSGGTQPTNAYDVTLLDEQGVDVLGGQGANLANNATTHVKPGVPLKDGTTTSVAGVHMDDKLELQVANGGDSKGGTVYLYVR